MGITQLSYFVRFFGGLIAIVAGIIHEGKINVFRDIQRLFRVAALIKPTFSHFSQVWDEFRDLDDQERDELRTVLAIELDMEFADDEQKKQLDRGLNGALNFLELIVSFKKN